MVADTPKKRQNELLAQAFDEINGSYGDERVSLLRDLREVEWFLQRAFIQEEQNDHGLTREYEATWEWWVAVALVYLQRIKQFHGLSDG